MRDHHARASRWFQLRRFLVDSGVMAVRADLVEAVVACATDLGHPPSSSEYERWRRRAGFPSLCTVRAGRRWPEVLAEAGVGFRQVGRWTEDQAWFTVGQIRRELGPSPSPKDFAKWQLHASPRPMSQPVLLARTGRTWAELFPKERVPL